MADVILFNQNLGNFEFTGSGDKKTATTTENVLTIPEEFLSAENYVYNVDGVDYVCDYVVDGTNWWTFSYKVDGSDAISVRKNKSDGHVEISIRPSLVDGLNLESSTLILKQIEQPQPEEPKFKTALVRFNRDKAVYLKYDETNDTITMEVL